MLGDKIKALRQELGLSQDELAHKMGYKSRSSINKIENGRPVSQKIIYRLAEVLGTTPAHLMGWDEQQNDPEAEIEAIKAQYKDLSPEKIDLMRRIQKMTPEELEKFELLLSYVERNF